MFAYYLKLSWLSIKRTPMITMLMVVAIGMGIGVSMTVLTVNYLMGKDPIPSKSGELFHVQLYTYGEGIGNSRVDDEFPYQVTYQDAMNLQQSDIPTRKTRSVATGFSIIPEKADQTPFIESARAIDSDFFAMFKILFVYGEVWDKTVDVSPRNVVVIGKELNEKIFSGENSVGREINLEGNLFTVVGVIDDWQPTPRFYDLNNGSFNSSERLFLPFSLLPVLELPSWGNNNGWKEEIINTYQDILRSERLWNQYWVELNTLKQKEEYIDWINGYISEQKKLERFTHENASVSLKNVTQWLNYNKVVSSDNSILVGLALMFLVVCMINTLGLLLSKFMNRAPEIGVRRALGASRRTIFFQHIVDVGMIGLAGGLLGLCLSQVGLMGVKSLYSDYNSLVEMDITLMIGSITIAIISSVLAGMYPAWIICKTNPSVYLKIQ
ncbi:MAG: ABC transporter ATP-binding protein [Gammaproteobacteria bacterium]|nr:MAG: ABC transporter ATP-binding protein [Gammaproteobacteria bacterium]